MLITVSGPVGSGKSTLGAELARQLSERGQPVPLVSFQKLPCFRWLRRDDPTAAKYRGQQGDKASTTRRARYQRKTLTLMGTGVHVGRILVFRAFRLSRRGGGPVVLNRYFYDSLTHYDLDTITARAYVAVIRWLIPKPDLAFVLESDAETLATRRPLYARDYLQTAVDAYRALPHHFPELSAIASVDGSAREATERVLAIHAVRSRR